MTKAHFDWHDAVGDVELATSGLTGVLCAASLLLSRCLMAANRRVLSCSQQMPIEDEAPSLASLLSSAKNGVWQGASSLKEDHALYIRKPTDLAAVSFKM